MFIKRYNWVQIHDHLFLSHTQTHANRIFHLRNCQHALQTKPVPTELILSSSLSSFRTVALFQILVSCLPTQHVKASLCRQLFIQIKGTFTFVSSKRSRSQNAFEQAQWKTSSMAHAFEKSVDYKCIFLKIPLSIQPLLASLPSVCVCCVFLWLLEAVSLAIC